MPAWNRRHKWTKAEQNVNGGDVVLVVSADSPRGSWPLARVLGVSTGRDSKVRAAKLKLGARHF